MVIEITTETVLVFIGFIVIVFLLYKLFKLLVRASIIVVAAFVFPWVAQYFGLPLQGSLENGITFAIVGLGLFLVYEFFHFLVQFFRIISWPFRKKK
jgi:hypothetical protein